jgi:hypothetical protein
VIDDPTAPRGQGQEQKMNVRKELAAALQSVRDGARESKSVYVGKSHSVKTAGWGSVSYIRTSRGIVRIEIGPDGQRFSERLIERA